MADFKLRISTIPLTLGDQGQHVGSQARYKLNTEQANKSPSPLVRMKKIHDSQEEEEMRGKSLLETAGMYIVS